MYTVCSGNECCLMVTKSVCSETFILELAGLTHYHKTDL